MVCSKCGAINDATAKFCSSCGNTFETNNVPINQNVPPVTYSNNHVEQVVSNIPVSNVQLQKKSVDIKKWIVVGLLLAIIVVMIILVIVSGKKNNSSATSDGNVTRTVMIYMVGSNLETDAKIATSDIDGINPSEIDLSTMNVILYTGGTEKWHNFVSNEENAIYELTAEGFQKKETYPKEDMGDPKTLTTLLNYGYENYKTDEYDLIFYNHGGAIDGAIYDDFTGEHLTALDMETALKASKFSKNNKLEVVLFRTCLNGTLEVASQLDDYADYLVASEEVTNGASGSSVFDFLNHIETTDSAIDYGKKFISGYEEYIDEIDPMGMGTVPMYAIIDLSKVDKVISELGKFVDGIDLNNNYADVIRVRSNLYQYAYSFHGDGSYDMVDLYSLVDGIDDFSSVSSKNLLDSINEAVVYNWSEAVQESHGLSIYFPYKGSTLVQNRFINVYNEIDFDDSYTSFIKKISNLVKSNQSSNFSKSDITSNTSDVKKGEFTLELTKEQAADYAEAYYIVFEKQEDNLYMPIYSSDNAILDGNKVKTNVTNNLLKIIDHSDESSAYIQLVERSRSGVKSYQSSAVAFYFGESDDLSDFEVEALTLHIDYDKNGKPYIAKTSITENDSAISTRFVDINHYEYIQFTNYRYGILDANGNYNPNWESSDIKYLFEVNTESDYELVNVSLDDGDYYAIFGITDIYGNSFYSNLVSVNK